MSNLKKCDFCGDIAESSKESASYLRVNVTIGSSSWGTRGFDICKGCQEEREIYPQKATNAVQAKELFDELVRGIIREELEYNNE